MMYMLKTQCALCSEYEDCSIMYVTKDLKLAVHQDCLLYSSRFVEPEEHKSAKNLSTRFHMPSVRKEVMRGRKLKCHFCGEKGATVGCEEKKCQKSYHYLCALKDNVAKNLNEGIYELHCQEHDPVRKTNLDDGVNFLKKCKEAGLLDGIFKKMVDTLRQAQEKLEDDNTPEAEYRDTVISLFTCSLFENIPADVQSETEGKIQELQETRKRLGSEMEAVDTQIKRLKDLKAALPAPEDTSASTSE